MSVNIEALIFADKEGILHVPDAVVTETIIQRVNQLCYINTQSDEFKVTVHEIITDGNIGPLW